MTDGWVRQRRLGAVGSLLALVLGIANGIGLRSAWEGVFTALFCLGVLVLVGGGARYITWAPGRQRAWVAPVAASACLTAVAAFGLCRLLAPTTPVNDYRDRQFVAVRGLLGHHTPVAGHLASTYSTASGIALVVTVLAALCCWVALVCAVRRPRS